jgi:hypothetical protein
VHLRTLDKEIPIHHTPLCITSSGEIRLNHVRITDRTGSVHVVRDEINSLPSSYRFAFQGQSWKVPTGRGPSSLSVVFCCRLLRRIGQGDHSYRRQG